MMLRSDWLLQFGLLYVQADRFDAPLI